MSVVASAAVLAAGLWLLLSADAPEYRVFGAVLVAVAVAGLAVHALISGRRRRGGTAGGPGGGAARVPR